MCVCVCVCVCVRERERERERERDGVTSQHISYLNRSLCVCVSVCERERQGKRRYISDAACGVRSITMHCASWPIRADCAGRMEGLCRKRSV